MRIFAEEMDIIDDLKLCLIRNRTSIPFVTSDDPAVMTNRWYLADYRNLGRSPNACPPCAYKCISTGTPAFLSAM
jgi:hypothetical protein